MEQQIKKDRKTVALALNIMRVAGKEPDWKAAMDWTSATAKEALKLIGLTTLEGYMGRDVTHRTGPNYEWSKTSIAVNAADGSVDWVNVMAWDLNLSEYKKGCYVRVVGKMEINEWEDPDTGEFRQNMEIIAEGFGGTDRPAARAPRCRIIERHENRYEGNPSSAVFRSQGEVLGLVHDDTEEEEAAKTV